MKWYISRFAILFLFFGAFGSNNVKASPAYDLARLQLTLAESAYLLEQNAQTLSRLIASRETILTLICPLREVGEEAELPGRCREEVARILQDDSSNPVAQCVLVGSKSRGCIEAYRGRSIEVDRSAISTSDDSRLSNLRHQAIQINLELRENLADKAKARRLIETFTEAMNLACPNIRNEILPAVQGSQSPDKENLQGSDSSTEEGPLSQLSNFLSGDSLDPKPSSVPSRVRKIPRVCAQLISESNSLWIPLSAGQCIRFGPFSPECYDAIQKEKEYLADGEPAFSSPPAQNRHGAGRF
jgi:hypothetical protein